MTRYIIDQQTYEEIAMRHSFFWSNHRAEPIGKCKDCAHWATDRRYSGKCIGKDGTSNPDGFCAWFKKREKK